MLNRGPRFRYTRLLTVSGLLAVGAVAQGSGGMKTQEALPLTTEEAVALALSSNLQLQSLETRVEMQQYRRSAGGLNNPELRVRNLSTRSVDDDFDELVVGIRWRPPVPGEADEQRQEDQVTLWQRKVEARRARGWLASRVRRAGADVVLYRELTRIAEQRMRNEITRIAQIESMVELGQRSIVYYTNAKTKVSAARNQHARYLRALGDEERRLQRLTGVSGPINMISETLPQVTATEEALLAIAASHRPEARLVEARQQLAIDRHQRERWRGWPRLSYVEASRHRESGAGDWHEFRFGLEVPLFDRHGGRTKATQLGIARKEIEALAVREGIEDEVHDRFAAYKEAQLAWQLAQEDGRLYVEDATRVIAQATVHGTVPADEVLELERAILDTEVLTAKRRREVAHSIYFLYYALGIDEPKQIATNPAR
jgi:outer membrane protein TolC